MRIRTFLERHDLAFIMGAALVCRIFAAVFSTGFVAADEHFQLLEPAYGLVHGYFYKAWEWEQGLRSWLNPGIYAVLLRILNSLGAREPEAVAMLLRMLTSFFSLLGVWATWQIALMTTDRWIARIAAGTVAVWWGFVYFGVRTLSEPIAMSISLLAFAAALAAVRIPRPLYAVILALSSGLLSGFSFGVRFQTALLAVSLAAFFIFAVRKKRTLIVPYLGGLAFMVVAIGLLDLATWGSFLHSPIAYFDYNIIHNGASVHFGSHPWHRYIIELNHFFGPPLTLGILFFCLLGTRKIRENWPIALWILPFLLVHQLIGHKELRFIIPVLPMILVYALLGFRDWTSRLTPPRRAAIFLLLACITVVTGIWQSFHHPWKWNGDVTHLYSQLGHQPDLGELFVCGTTGDHTGGYFYLNRAVPLRIFPDLSACPPPPPARAELRNRARYYVFGDAPTQEVATRCINMAETLGRNVFRCL